VLWLRDQSIENYTMSRADARSWLAELLATVVDWNGVYRPGPHCAHCPRSRVRGGERLIRRESP
jgi:hypothetical protein